LFSFLCMMGTVSETWCQWDMNVFYTNSKTYLKLWCDYCIKFQLFEGAQDFFSSLTAVCFILLPHNPYRLPQHYKRHFCGPSCSRKHRFLWISPIFFYYVLSELYGYSMLLTTFLVNKECSLRRPVLIFQPTVNSSAGCK
jgi:hypothetical protein